MVLIEPATDEVKKMEARAPGKRKRVRHKLRDRPFGLGAGLIVDDMNGAVSNLEKINMPGEGHVALKRNDKAGQAFELRELIGR